ncbi:CRC domain-containing protein TSO1-like [Pistacia vera]|uniref:CRC domain-containing protein TSO1-like n=1 Tax=Pistacia vera TaxID=55513 RepID=UPI001263E270|nr:CRC domain-containing protein TSO1-like [Pistacia vera]
MGQGFKGLMVQAQNSAHSSSPAVQDSPFFNYLSNLSPIQSVKAARYAQRFFESRFPTPPPVFRSPHVDLQRETSFLKSNDVDAGGSDVYGYHSNQVNNKLIACLQKEVQPSSPSACVDEYLTDPVEVEDSKISADLRVQPTNNVGQLLRCGFTGPRENIRKVNDANNGNPEDYVLMLPEQSRVNMPSSLNLVETADYQAESSTLPVSGAENPEQHVTQNAGIQHNEQDGSCQLLPESLQSVEAHQDCSDSSRPVSKGSFKEATLYQRGIRRHLQFEAPVVCKSTTTHKSHSSHNVIQEVDNSKVPASHTDLESLIFSDVDPGEVSNGRESISYSPTIASWTSFSSSEFVGSNQHSRSLAISGPIPSDSGLHLKSIGRSGPMDSDLIPRLKLSGYMSSKDHGRRDCLAKDSNRSLFSPEAGEIHAHVDNYQQDNQTFVETGSAASQCNESMKSLCDSLHMTPSKQGVSSECRILISRNTERVEELNQVSPKTKRKKAINAGEGDGCKRCNCRRSKCLKLYCECFAAGVFCVDSCACKDCFNKPEYEDTVLDLRQQIESRDPLAFAPKIVKHATNSPANIVEDGNWTTPASARHKRGCNCKKSKCLKKYCECYQANVGCSDGCRCEDCCNSFGKKADSVYRRVQRWDNPSADGTKSGTLKQFSPRWEDLPDISHFTPLSLPYAKVLASSASPISDYQEVPHAQLHQGSTLKSSSGHRHWHSSMSFMPHLCESSAGHGCSSDSAFHDLLKDDDMPETLKETSTPTKTIKVSSPNQKRVSPPQSRSQELRSSSSPGLRSGRKFILQAMPSFPPLTPYMKSKNDTGRSDLKGEASDH